MVKSTPATVSSPANRPMSFGCSGFPASHRVPAPAVATPGCSLRVMGLTSHGHLMLRAESKTLPGRYHDVLVSKTGKSVSCDCAACAFHPQADENGRLTVKRADVLAGKVVKCCWHLRRAAKLAPLFAAGFVTVKEARA